MRETRNANTNLIGFSKDTKDFRSFDSGGFYALIKILQHKVSLYAEREAQYPTRITFMTRSLVPFGESIAPLYATPSYFPFNVRSLANSFTDA